MQRAQLSPIQHEPLQQLIELRGAPARIRRGNRRRHFTTQIPTQHYDLKVARNRVDMRPCLAKHGRVVGYGHEYWRRDAIRVHIDRSVRS
ncbi:hypothetical protein [Sphingomonas sp.]|uniref:hypothetical protein n=1 Tax=Sphingomonas sp. TaxID=28214 RepID=UPI003B3B2874